MVDVCFTSNAKIRLPAQQFEKRVAEGSILPNLNPSLLIMPRPIGWTKTDQELGKLKVEARFFGNRLSFHHQAARFDNWEEFEPNEEDWDTLQRLSENKFQRGKMSQKHMNLVKARGRKV